MKTLLNQFVRIIPIIITLLFTSACNKENFEDFLFILTLTHSDYDSIKSNNASVTVLIDEEFFDEENTLTSTSSSYSGFSISPEEGNDANRNISVGESVTTTFKFPSSKEKVNIRLKLNNLKTIEVNDIANNSEVEWDFANEAATVNNFDGTDDNEAGTNDEACSNWYESRTGCLSSEVESDGFSKAGYRSRDCRISETTNSVTYKVTYEPINGGIDPIYGDVFAYITVEGESHKLTRQEFNSNGFETTITTIKYFPEGEFPLTHYMDCRD